MYYSFIMTHDNMPVLMYRHYTYIVLMSFYCIYLLYCTKLALNIVTIGQYRLSFLKVAIPSVFFWARAFLRVLRQITLKCNVTFKWHLQYTQQRVVMMLSTRTAATQYCDQCFSAGRCRTSPIPSCRLYYTITISFPVYAVLYQP